MRTRIAVFALLASSLGLAQTIAPYQIRPGSNGQTLQTVGGVAAWADVSGGSGCGALAGDVTSTLCGDNSLVGATGTDQSVFGYTNGNGNTATDITYSGVGNGNGSMVSPTGNPTQIVLMGNGNLPVTPPTQTDNYGAFYGYVVGIGANTLGTLSLPISGTPQIGQRVGDIVAIGDEAMGGFGPVTGSEIIAIGDAPACTLDSNESLSAESLVALGISPACTVGTGAMVIEEEVALGDCAGCGVSGTDYIAIGDGAGSSNRLYSVNPVPPAINDLVAIGDGAGSNIGTNSDDIVALGQGSGSYLNANSSDVVAIGHDAGPGYHPSPSTYTNIVAIGAHARITTSNQTVIGNSSVTSLQLFGCPAGQTAYDDGSGTCYTPSGGAVASVFGRTGAVTAQSGDYTVGQVTGAAPIASPTFTGTLTTPGLVISGFGAGTFCVHSVNGTLGVTSTDCNTGSGGSITAVSASGALTSSGGTSPDISISSSTGSGAVVLATSPILVTPALGTPSALVGTNITGTAAGLSIGGNAATATSAAKWTTARNLAGNSVDGSANVAYANKFIVQGTTDTGLSGAQFLGALGTGIVKNTTTTGVLSIAVAGTDYQAALGYTPTNAAIVPSTAPSAGQILVGNGTAYAPVTLTGPVAISSAGVTTVATLNQNTSGTAANLSGTPTVPNGTAATTQTAGDSTTKLATDAFVAAAIAAAQLSNATFTTNTTAVPANSCIVLPAVTMTGLLSSATGLIGSPTDVTSVTGWGIVGGLVFRPTPSANTWTIRECNQTSSPITPSASVTWNISGFNHGTK